MKTSIRFALAAVALVAVLPFPRAARADASAEFALKVGGGTSPTPGPNQANPLAFAIGGAFGVTFSGFYGAVTLSTYFGTAPNQPSYYASSQSGVSVHSLLIGVEGGYDVQVSRGLTLRPKIGIGDFSAPTNNDGGALPGIAGGSNVYVEPEVELLLQLGRWVFLGMDAGLLVIPDVKNVFSSTSSDTFSAFVMNGELGVRF